MAKGGISAEWDGPVKAKAHPIRDLKKCIRAELKAGPLRRSIRSAFSLSQKDTIEVWSSLPYSEIQDQGGNIPPFTIPTGQRKMVRKGYGQRLSRKRYKRVMVFQIGGRTIFTTKRRGFTLRPKHYVQKGVDKWLPGLIVKWVKKGSRDSGRFLDNA